MPEVVSELQAYLGAQMPGQGLALGVLGVVPPCDSPGSGGVLVRGYARRLAVHAGVDISR
jgi:hypothetical protein